jgi:hypothetical protein
MVVIARVSITPSELCAQEMSRVALNVGISRKWADAPSILCCNCKNVPTMPSQDKNATIFLSPNIDHNIN